MSLQGFFTSALALRLGLFLGRIIPRRLGYLIADGLTAVLARSGQSRINRALGSNLRVALGPEVPDEVVARIGRRVLQHAGRAYFDFYRAFAQGQEAALRAVKFTTQAEHHIREAVEQGRGAVVVGPHMSNYDLVSLAVAPRGIPVQVLAWADPTSGYALQNRLRSEFSVEWTSIDSQVLRQALRRLRSGGFVSTAVDRPDPFGGGEMLPFFGRPARLPVGHIRLAMQTRSPILVVDTEYRESDGHYWVHLVWMEVEDAGSRQETLLHNARRVLETMEGMIAAHPDQWLMFYPVWDEDLFERPHEPG